MAGGSFGNVSGVWRTIKNRYGNIGGVWRQIKYSYTNVGGVWRTAYQAIKALYTVGVQNVPWTEYLGATGTYANNVTWNASSVYIIGQGYGSGQDKNWDGSSIHITGIYPLDITGYTTLCIDFDVTECTYGYFSVTVYNGSQSAGYATAYYTVLARNTVRVSLATVAGLCNISIACQGYSGGYCRGNVYNVWLE